MRRFILIFAFFFAGCAGTASAQGITPNGVGFRGQG